MKNSNLNLLGLLKDGAFQFGRLTGPDLEAYARTFSALAALEVSKAATERRAAPELLAALQSIATTAGLCAITFPNAPGNGDLQAIVREARAAIAKATKTGL